jgi:HB1, ASXL, restriction endonuclease HTH domain
MIIETLLDACEFVLENQGEPQSSYWLASQVMETKLWRTSEAQVRYAVCKDIEQHGERSRFVRAAADEFALRRWSRNSP